MKNKNPYTCDYKTEKENEFRQKQDIELLV